MARHLVRGIAKEDPDLAERFCTEPKGEGAPEPRFSIALIERLIAHKWSHHVRELEAALWAALASSTGRRLALTADVEAELRRQGPSSDSAPVGELFSADDVRSALERNGGVKERAWRDLGLKNRWALLRLMKKYGID